MNNIPTLKPSLFKYALMSEYDQALLDKQNFDTFFIHNLSHRAYQLKIPLPPHRKTVSDIILLKKGKMIKSSGIDQYKVGNNSLFLLPAGQITTTLKISKKIEGFYLHFSDDFLIRKMDLAFWLNKPIINLTENEGERIGFLFLQIENNYKENFNSELIKSYLNTLLTEITHLSSSSKKKNLSTAEKVTLDFKLLINQYCKIEHKVEFYAKRLNITPNHLNKCIKTVLNKPASALISENLILEAKVLLHQQKWNISELAYELGFEDPSYFGRFFKKHTHQTPSTFLKMIDLSE